MSQSDRMTYSNSQVVPSDNIINRTGSGIDNVSNRLGSSITNVSDRFGSKFTRVDGVTDAIGGSVGNSVSSVGNSAGNIVTSVGSIGRPSSPGLIASVGSLVGNSIIAVGSFVSSLGTSTKVVTQRPAALSRGSSEGDVYLPPVSQIPSGQADYSVVSPSKYSAWMRSDSPSMRSGSRSMSSDSTPMRSGSRSMSSDSTPMRSSMRSGSPSMTSRSGSMRSESPSMRPGSPSMASSMRPGSPSMASRSGSLRSESPSMRSSTDDSPLVVERTQSMEDGVYRSTIRASGNVSDEDLSCDIDSMSTLEMSEDGLSLDSSRKINCEKKIRRSTPIIITDEDIPLDDIPQNDPEYMSMPVPQDVVVSRCSSDRRGSPQFYPGSSSPRRFVSSQDM